MKVLFITQFSSIGGSSRVQILQFLPYFQRAGIACDHVAIYSDRFYQLQNRIVYASSVQREINFLFSMTRAFAKKIALAWKVGAYDVVVIQREVFPRLLYWIMRKRNPRIIYEIEDTIYEINTFWKEGIVRTLGLRFQAKLCKNMMRHAAHIIAENEYHAAEARTYGHPVSFITAPIDTDMVCPGGERDDVTVTLGWIGGTPTTALLATLQPVFAAIGAKYPQARLVTVGAAHTFHADGIPHEPVAWNADTEVSELRRMDIGLMPLDDAPFNRGRLGYKMIQYMSVGIPIVADRVGLNTTVVRDGVNGFLVNSQEEWVTAIGKLIVDAELRKTLGAAGRKLAQERYAIPKQAERFIETVRYVGTQK